MQIKKRWVAFYSQTGTEVKRLVLDGYIPDLVITDNFTSYLKNCDFFKDNNIEHAIKVIKGSKKSKANKYRNALRKDDLITLHGWLNIVPGCVCNEYTIYNGHPGHIIDYPELKGKDPQERVYDELKKYKKVGSVVHRVTEEVDSGQIVSFAERPIRGKDRIESMQGIFHACSELSIRAWKEFFRNLDIIMQDELNYDGTFKHVVDIPLQS